MPRIGHCLSALGWMLIAGCFGASVSSTYLAPQRYAPRSPDYTIDLLQQTPTRPHVVLATISCRQAAVVGQQSGDKCVAKMRDAAREMGGDAIVGFQPYVAPDGTVGQGSFSAQAQVIRWQ